MIFRESTVNMLWKVKKISAYKRSLNIIFEGEGDFSLKEG